MIKYVNIKETDFVRKKLYRFTTISKLKECLLKNELYFSKPEKWKDPYENYYLNARFKWEGHDMHLPIKGNIFCLCFTERYNSEAYWLTYAPNKDGIRMEIDLTKLIKKLKRLSGISVYVGKVIYKNQQDFAKISKISKISGELKLNIGKLQQEIKVKNVGEEQIKLMLIKRKSFLYEEEVRIFIVPKETSKNKLYPVKIDFRDFVMKFYLDPRLDEKDYYIPMLELIKLYGVPETKVGRSILYRKLKRRKLYLDETT